MAANRQDREPKLEGIGSRHSTLLTGDLQKKSASLPKKRAEVGRTVRAEVKQIEASLIEQGVLERNWRQDWKL
jgi:hypothetical protein